MTFSRLNSFGTVGKVQSTTQGLVVGSMEVLPPASEYYSNVVVHYLGDDATGRADILAAGQELPYDNTPAGVLQKDHMYRCIATDQGIWHWEDVSPLYHLNRGENLVMGTNDNGDFAVTKVTTTEIAFLEGLDITIPDDTPPNHGETFPNLQNCLDSKVNRQYWDPTIEDPTNPDYRREMILSANDFNDHFKEKLSGIEAEAEVNIIETVFLNNIQQRTKLDPLGKNTKHLYMNITEGLTYNFGNLNAGSTEVVDTGLDSEGSRFSGAVIYFAQVRDGNGKVLNCDLTVTTPKITIASRETASYINCSLFIIVGPTSVGPNEVSS